LKLVGALTQGSGTVNEDGFGFIGEPGDIRAAWIFDGVTGINGRNHLPAGSDAQWLVNRAQHHVQRLAGADAALPDILHALVGDLIADWKQVKTELDLPPDYDPPAACLILAKRDPSGWKALRLGDSCLLARRGDGSHHIAAASPNNAFDHWLSREARKRRDAGVLDIKALLEEFRPQLMASRAKRNRPDGYSILECDSAALTMPEYLDLESPADLLLCTDGFYRAVDHYGLHSDGSLLDTCRAAGGVEQVLSGLRAAEASDPACERFPRFKPADDATALMLKL
jgi:Protein phosphatase 2C